MSVEVQQFSTPNLDSVLAEADESLHSTSVPSVRAMLFEMGATFAQARRVSDKELSPDVDLDKIQANFENNIDLFLNDLHITSAGGIFYDEEGQIVEKAVIVNELASIGEVINDERRLEYLHNILTTKEHEIAIIEREIFELTDRQGALPTEQPELANQTLPAEEQVVADIKQRRTVGFGALKAFSSVTAFFIK